MKGVENLINAPNDKEFVFHDGTRARNLLDLVSKLENMPDHAFHHFVNLHKNDFANWIEHILSDKRFSDRLRTTDSRLETIQMVKDRINEISLGIPVGGSLIKMSKLEDHVEEHHIDEAQVASHHEVEHHSEHPEHKVEEKVTHLEEHGEEHGVHHRDDDTSRVMDKPVEEKEKGGHSKKWFKLFSKKNTDEKRLEKIELVEERKHMSENELKEELMHDEKENTLWILLYFALILLIITLLVYKLFL